MPHILYIIGLISVAEICQWNSYIWRFNKFLASVIIISLSVASGILIIQSATIWALLLLIINTYRVVNLLRVVEHRSKKSYLLRVCRQTSLILIGLQIVIVILWYLARQYQYSISLLVVVCLCIQVIVAVTLLVSISRNARKMSAVELNQNLTDEQLPTLTIAIPARNETLDLQACLAKLTKSNYPKLEIVVLDDCSQSAKTPEIIRQFAHDGVRFIAGDVPPDKWLAKNFAYEQLLQQSNGELILFCGVDVRFDEATLREIVTIFLNKHKKMLSFMPINELPASSRIRSLIIQPSRYAWEIALPRKTFNRPPVLSTCWITQRQFLNKSGTFKAIKNSISPESYFAKQAVQADDGYCFLISSLTLGLSSSKSVDEQKATAVRTRYPQLHRRPEFVMLTSLLEIVSFDIPLLFFLYYLLSFRLLYCVSALIVCLLNGVFYAYISFITYRKKFVWTYCLAPIASMYDICILNLSMWLYEFKEVIWKERNVCIPVMQTYDKLPKA